MSMVRCANCSMAIDTDNPEFAVYLEHLGEFWCDACYAENEQDLVDPEEMTDGMAAH